MTDKNLNNPEEQLVLEDGDLFDASTDRNDRPEGVTSDEVDESALDELEEIEQQTLHSTKRLYIDIPRADLQDGTFREREENEGRDKL